MTTASCTGTRYPINPDAPEEGTDIRHDGGPCPAHPDARIATDTTHIAAAYARLFTCRTHSDAVAAGGCPGSFTTARDADAPGLCPTCNVDAGVTADGYVAPHVDPRVAATVDALVSGGYFARHAISANSAIGYRAPLTARRYGTAMERLARMAAESDRLAQVARNIFGHVNLYGTPEQAAFSVYSNASQAMAAGFDDVLGRSGPEAGRHSDHQHATTARTAITVALWLSHVTEALTGDGTVGWTLATAARLYDVDADGIARRARR